VAHASSGGRAGKSAVELGEIDEIDGGEM